MDLTTDKPELLGLRVSGGVAVLLGFGLAALALVANPGAHGLNDWRVFLVPAAIFMLMGVGTLLRRRFAAVVLAIVFCLQGLLLVVGGMLQVEFPWVTIDVACGLLALMPVWLVYRDWKKLLPSRGLSNEPRPNITM